MWIIRFKELKRLLLHCLTNGSVYDKVCRHSKGVFVVSEKVILTCTECLSRNYTTTRNKKTRAERLELNKYCKKCGKYTVHKETK